MTASLNTVRQTGHVTITLAVGLGAPAILDRQTNVLYVDSEQATDDIEAVVRAAVTSLLPQRPELSVVHGEGAQPLRTCRPALRLVRTEAD